MLIVMVEYVIYIMLNITQLYFYCVYIYGRMYYFLYIITKLFSQYKIYVHMCIYAYMVNILYIYISATIFTHIYVYFYLFITLHICSCLRKFVFSNFFNIFNYI